ncbi:hypothetical protein [Heyndrickxia acidiproducens]|nr:hypothetical protein [Heyndrickxia acidiproducens]
MMDSNKRRSLKGDVEMFEKPFFLPMNQKAAVQTGCLTEKQAA